MRVEKISVKIWSGSESIFGSRQVVCSGAVIAGVRARRGGDERWERYLKVREKTIPGCNLLGRRVGGGYDLESIWLE